MERDTDNSIDTNTDTDTKSGTSYSDLLKDERWIEKRDSIIRRDKCRCRYCGSIDNLQVHHKYYNKINDYGNIRMVEPWDYPDDALITLCDDCHKKVHSRKEIKTYWRSKKK